MYCHEVTYRDKEGIVRGIIEDSPDSGVGMLIWENEFKTKPERRKKIIESICEYLDSDGIKYKIYWDENRS